MNVMKIAWILKKEKDISLSQALKEAWLMVKEENKINLDEQQVCKRDNLLNGEYKLIKNNRIAHIISKNVKYYLENRCDKKPYVKNGVSFIETSHEYYQFLLHAYIDKKLVLKNLIYMYGKDSTISKHEIEEYKLWIMSFKLVKVM